MGRTKMSKQNKEYWAYWWEQVEKGFVPETAYRMAKLREKLEKKNVDR